ncbi:leucyl aminopeptidase [Candidatus Uhrbacteria bacterium]|nr:leucyl aminopeptidase [Candidatus Uhrbacteria bacterium]
MADALRDTRFEGKDDQAIVVPATSVFKSKRVLVLGLGEKPTPESLRRAAAQAAQQAKRFSAATLAFALPAVSLRQPNPHGQALAEGVILGRYQFLKYKKAPDKKPVELKHVALLAPTRVKRAVLQGLHLGQIFAQAATLARDLVNEPAASMTPAAVVERARAVAKLPGISLRVFDRAEIERRKMGSFLSVAQGSDQPPFFLHFTYKPKGAKKRVVLAGKGITFDAGGIHLKPAKHIETMKCDMAGAASVLAVFSALSELKPKVEVHGLVPLTENMPSGKATKPGDVVRASNGRSIEVVNTDAEGRLVLADALIYGAKLKPDAMIDLATLTGSCVVALGEEVAGLMSTSKPLAKSLLAAAETVGEPVWELPLVASYRKLMDSEIADIANIAKVPWGGVIEGGLFLKEFVGKMPWAHLDIAGPAFAERPFGPYTQNGGTGFGVRTILQYLMSRP